MYMYFVFWMLSLLTASYFRSKTAQIFFVVAIFVFVGLRFETAFDWPTYKDGFEALQVNFSLDFAQWRSEEHTSELQSQ